MTGGLDTRHMSIYNRVTSSGGTFPPQGIPHQTFIHSNHEFSTYKRRVSLLTAHSGDCTIRIVPSGKESVRGAMNVRDLCPPRCSSLALLPLCVSAPPEDDDDDDSPAFSPSIGTNLFIADPHLPLRNNNTIKQDVWRQ